MDTLDEDEVTFRHMLNTLTEHKELIITIDEDGLPEVRKGLTALKGRDTQKMKTAGIIVAEEVLSYTSYSAKDKDGKDIPGCIKVHITLSPRKGIRVYNMQLPDDKI